MRKQDQGVSKPHADDEADFAPVLELAKQIVQVHEQAKHEYQPIVDRIIRSGQRDVAEIERTLDGLLNFAGSDTCLPLFRRLCRYYWDIDPVATAEYVHAYREMWDSE
jgi:hypothetical protein